MYPARLSRHTAASLLLLLPCRAVVTPVSTAVTAPHHLHTSSFAAARSWTSSVRSAIRGDKPSRLAGAARQRLAHRMSEKPQQQQAKRHKSDSGTTTGMAEMGVDIRVPSGWVVGSTAVEGKKCIGTHSGSFHCDEALACAMLKILPEWSDAVIVRTRDEAELAKCDAVVDVGGVYDPTTLRFDHHQKTFHDTLSEENFQTRLSSAGLVYRHYGRQILKQLVEGTSVPEDVVDKKLYAKVYKNFVEHIDGIDNGVDVAKGADLSYDISSHLSARVGQLNPSWNEPSDPEGPDGPNARFKKAMSLTGGELCRYVQGLAKSWWPGRAIVAESLARRKEDHPSGEIMVLTGFCPWKGHLLELEEEMGIAGELKFVLYAEGDPAGKWRIQAVPVSEGSFALRLPLAKPWLGLRDKELSEASGIEGGVFVHVNGFIGGNASKAGAMAMASKSLELAAAAAT
ncbi:unnamed protein product [Ectocarpus sp. 12 AP-2014]